MNRYQEALVQWFGSRECASGNVSACEYVHDKFKEAKEDCFDCKFNDAWDLFNNVSNFLEGDGGMSALDKADRKVQIAEAIEVLSEYSDKNEDNIEDSLEILSGLLKVCLKYHAWSKSQKEYFDKIVCCLKEGPYCFISYTRADAAHVNDQYRHVIEINVPPGERVNANDDEEPPNLLAYAVYHGLRKKFFRKKALFLDKHSICYGDSIPDRVKEGAKKSIVLLTILEPQIFERRETGCNWNHSEYREFITKPDCKSPDSVASFFLNVSVKGSNFEDIRKWVCNEYRPWCQEMLDKNRADLPMTESGFRKMLDQVARVIREKRKKISEAVPD